MENDFGSEAGIVFCYIGFCLMYNFFELLFFFSPSENSDLFKIWGILSLSIGVLQLAILLNYN